MRSTLLSAWALVLVAGVAHADHYVAVTPPAPESGADAGFWFRQESVSVDHRSAEVFMAIFKREERKANDPAYPLLSQGMVQRFLVDCEAARMSRLSSAHLNGDGQEMMPASDHDQAADMSNPMIQQLLRLTCDKEQRNDWVEFPTVKALMQATASQRPQH